MRINEFGSINKKTVRCNLNIKSPDVEVKRYVSNFKHLRTVSYHENKYILLLI